MRSFWIYTLARLGIIVAVGLLLQPFLGFTLVMAVAAILIGALISYLALGGMRAKVAGDIEHRLANRRKSKKRKGARTASSMRTPPTRPQRLRRSQKPRSPNREPETPTAPPPSSALSR